MPYSDKEAPQSDQVPIGEHPLYTDPAYAESMQELDGHFFVKVPRDGNCFYTSYARLVYPLVGGRAARDAFMGKKALFDAAGASPAVYETYMEHIEELLDSKGAAELLEDDLMAIVGYLRLAVASYIETDASFFGEFLPETDPAAYVQECVNPMGQRAGEVEMAAISRVFDFRLTVVTVQKEGCSRYSYGQGPDISILHTPDHFEPLYGATDL
ncbi:ubiquitin thioesterase protein OTUB2 [Pancytospora philotis]|nr:ubiquitin thioesterase protein OTUB2 [Pancytospora philotis]